MLAGMALGSAGVSFQALLNNPLADPYILGVSGGAALGCVIGLGLGLPFGMVTALAFIASFASMLFIYWASRFNGKLPPHTLLLTGVIFNAFAFAFIILIHSLVTMEQAHEILFTLIGNLEIQSYSMIAVVAACVTTGFVALTLVSGRLNVISLGEETAESLGLDLDRTRGLVFFLSSLMVAAVVSVSGLIGFVGLFVPHIARRLFGSDHRLIVPASGLIGAAFLIVADTLSRTVMMGVKYQTQLPVGAITALVGAPFFVWLLRRGFRNLK
jgi:iron complex transport system permease protein